MKTTFGADGRKPKLRHNLVVKLFSGTPLSQFGEVVTASPSDAQKKNAAKATVRTRHVRPAVEIPLAEPAAMRIVPIARLAAGGRWRVEAMRALSEPVLLWFTRGQGRITVGGITRGYGAHNAVFIPAGMMHCFDVGSQTFGSALFFGADHGLDLPAEPLHLRIRDVVPQAELSGIIDNIQRETDSQRPASQKAALHYLGLMEREFRSGKGVSELAKELGVTATHLTRVCNKTCGRSASDLLHDRLIFEARRILAETRTPVAEVARSLGFNSAAYFTRAFQHRVGKTPSAFRKSS
jgi:AraC-like DNA-binding protein